MVVRRDVGMVYYFPRYLFFQWFWASIQVDACADTALYLFKQVRMSHVLLIPGNKTKYRIHTQNQQKKRLSQYIYINMWYCTVPLATSYKRWKVVMIYMAYGNIVHD